MNEVYKASYVDIVFFFGDIHLFYCLVDCGSAIRDWLQKKKKRFLGINIKLRWL